MNDGRHSYWKIFRGGVLLGSSARLLTTVTLEQRFVVTVYENLTDSPKMTGCDVDRKNKAIKSGDLRLVRTCRPTKLDRAVDTGSFSMALVCKIDEKER